jgi:hypothetical protein
MPQLTLSVKANIRDLNARLHNFNTLANVSEHYYDASVGGLAERSEKNRVNNPDWSFSENTGISPYFKRHNGFRDHERHNRMARSFVMRQGAWMKYYPTSYDPSGDPLYNEDNNRVIERVFDMPAILSFQPENELYNKFNIQHMDEDEAHFHMTLFLELNYQSLRRAGIAPKCPPDTHNPIWSQRGYEAFSFHGYSFDQIGPKAGDKIKIEAFNSLYEVESIKDASPEYQHRGRKYWWKVFYKDAFDQSQNVSTDVLLDPEQKQFINDLMGTQDGLLDNNGNAMDWEFDRSKKIDELKKDVLFRPPEVEQDVENISEDPDFHPGFSKFDGW